MPQFAKLDDISNLSAEDLVREIYNDDPDVILNVIRSARRPPHDVFTAREEIAQLVETGDIEANDVVLGYVDARAQASAERGTALRSLLASIFDTVAALETHEAEATLMLAFGDERFSNVVVSTVLWECYSFRDLADLVANLSEKLAEHCDDDTVLRRLRPNVDAVHAAFSDGRLAVYLAPAEVDDDEG